MSIFSPTGPLHDLNSDKDILPHTIIPALVKQKSDDRRQNATTAGNLTPNDYSSPKQILRAEDEFKPIT
jgi:hypothetical protein